MKDETRLNSTDLLGIASYGEALKITVENSFKGAEAVLSRICLPAAEELGLMFRDKVRYWRLNNIIKIINKSENKIDFSNERFELSAHPRVVHEIIENGSWCDDEDIQEMWSGILVSSCNEKTGDDSNLIFINTLKQLTKNQVKLLNYLCENCKINVDKHGFLFAEHIEISFENLCKILNTKNLHQLDSELDFLRSIELLMEEKNTLGGHIAGFLIGHDNITAQLEPSPFAINLFIKGKGFKGEPKDYFKIEYVEPENNSNII
jgi:hypothetical protein